MGGASSSAADVANVGTAGNRMKPKTGAAVRKGMKLTSTTYQMYWALDPDKPDRYHKRKRFDKFRELGEVTKPVWAFDLAEYTMVLAAALADSNVHLWDLLMDPPELKVTLRMHEAHVWAVVFAPNELAVATASSDKTVRVWVSETGMPLQVLHAHTEGVRCLAFSMDGLLLSGGMDSQICLWEYEATLPTAQWKAHEGHVHSISFVPRSHQQTDNRSLALSVGADGAVCAWHIEQGNYKALGKFPGGGGKGVLCVAQHSTEDNWCACGNEDGAVWIWNYALDDSGNSEQIEVPGNLKLVGHKQSVRTVAFTPDGCLLASGSTDGMIRVWDVRKMCEKEHEVTCVSIFKAHDSWVTELRFEGGSRGIVSCSADGLVKHWVAPRRLQKLYQAPRPDKLAKRLREAEEEAEEEPNIWQYDAGDGQPLALREAPKLTANRTGWFLHPSDTFRVTEEKEGTGGIIWLQVADGFRHGWAYTETPEGLSLCLRVPKEPSEATKLAAKADITTWTNIKKSEQLTDFSKGQLKQVGTLFRGATNMGLDDLLDDDSSDDDSDSSEEEEAAPAAAASPEGGQKQVQQQQPQSTAAGAEAAGPPAPASSQEGTPSKQPPERTPPKEQQLQTQPPPPPKRPTPPRAAPFSQQPEPPLPGALSEGAPDASAQGAAASSSAGVPQLAAAPKALPITDGLPGGLPPPPPPPPPSGGPVPPGVIGPPPARHDRGQLDPMSRGVMLQARIVQPPHRQTLPPALAKAAGVAAANAPPPGDGQPRPPFSAVDLAH